MTWQKTRLNRLGFVSRGKSKHRPRDAAHLYDGPFPLIQTGDIKRAGLYLTEYEQTYSEAGLAQSKLWPKGTLCITIAANIGDTSILGIEACFPDSVIGFIPDKRKADARFIKYLFDATLQRRFQQFSRGATQDNLSQAKLLSMPLLVPSVEEQRELADAIACYDDLIENNRKRIGLLERATRLIYKEWFVRLRFPGHEKVKMTKSVLGAIPSSWQVVPIGDLCTKIGSGATPRGGAAAYHEEGITLIRSMNVYDFNFDTGGLAFISEEQADELANVAVQEQDILLNITGASVGRCCTVPPRLLPARVNQHVIIVRVDKAKADAAYVLCAINSDNRKAQLLSLAQGKGATREALAKTTVEQFPIVLPDKSTHDAFVTLVGPMFKQREILDSQNIQLTRARDLLLPRLMSGKVKV